MEIGVGAIHPPDLEAQFFPDGSRRGVKRLRAPVIGEVNDPAAAGAVQEHVDISQESSAIPRGHDGNAHDPVARRGALSGHGIEEM